MTVVQTSQVEVVEAVVERLISQIEPLNERTCYLSIFPTRPQTFPSDFCVQVSPHDGQYDERAWVGGGINTTIEEAIVVITIFSRIELDQAGRDLSFLTHTSRGVLVLKQLILKYLSGHDLLNDAGERILTDNMKPAHAEAPGRADRAAGDLAIAFETNFHWDLTTEVT